jgi:hypothetical protein
MDICSHDNTASNGFFQQFLQFKASEQLFPYQSDDKKDETALDGLQAARLLEWRVKC